MDHKGTATANLWDTNTPPTVKTHNSSVYDIKQTCHVQRDSAYIFIKQPIEAQKMVGFQWFTA